MPIPEWRRFQSAGLEAWLGRYRGLRESRGGHRCLYWVERGRCSRACEADSAWGDHPSAWIGQSGRPAVLVFQPYGFPRGYLDLSRQLRRHPGLFLRMERPENGWHHPSTSLIEIWRDEDAYRAAIGSK